MSKQAGLTRRQRFWMEHLRACAERGQPLSAYAAEHGLPVGSLYEAKRRLRRKGAWPVAAHGFVRVQAETPEISRAMPVVYRVTLPNGVVVESAGGELEAVLTAAARLP